MSVNPIRVMIVDDSALMRRMLSGMVADDAGMTVAAIAANGSIALQKLAQTEVDLVVMDVEMPVMDGIEAVARIRVDRPQLPVLMCSAITIRGAAATLRALAAGATDYVAKPSGLNGDGAVDDFRTGLLERIRALASMRAARSQPRPAVPAPRDPVQAASGRIPPAQPRVLAIGCSTGGPNALGKIFAELPAHLGVPIVITQHMPPLFTRMLGERLTAGSKLAVKEAEQDDILLPGHAYIAPGDYHMSFRRHRGGVQVVLDQGPQQHCCRPAVDVMFRSVAEMFGRDTVAAVLTGMGRDGALGAKAIAAAGGWVVTQEAKSCVVASMPGAVAELGASHEVADLEAMSHLLARRCKAFGSRVAPVV